MNEQVEAVAPPPRCPAEVPAWWPVDSGYPDMSWFLQNQAGEWWRKPGDRYSRRFKTAAAAVAFADKNRLPLLQDGRVPSYPIGELPS